MSQHDMTLDNASGLVFRNDANAALQALASQSSGASAPSPTFPCQVWGDTGTGRLKQRNAANAAWLDKGPLDAPLRDAASQGEFVADTGAANAYVCNFVPAITARSEATPIRFKAANANTGACTINDGVGTVALVGANNAALRGGEIFANGIAWIQWNASISGGSYVLLFCTGSAAPVAVVGAVRNLKMLITAASASATLTADEISVKFALGAQPWLLQSFNKSINLATTGAGGMDVGTAPTSGFVAIYAIYNPGSGASALLATNATAVKAPEVYGGANMPAGYTASALLSVWPTDASKLLKPGNQNDRRINFPAITVITTTATTSGATLAIASAVPINARSVNGAFSLGATGSAGYIYCIVYSDSTLSGAQSFNGNTSLGNVVGCPFNKLDLTVAQQMYYAVYAATGINVSLSISGYEI